jgi:hypothetical protein
MSSSFRDCSAADLTSPRFYLENFGTHSAEFSGGAGGVCGSWGWRERGGRKASPSAAYGGGADPITEVA